MVITLDLNEVADEWQELLDEYASELVQAEDEPATRGITEARDADVKQYEALCDALGLTPKDPPTLRWYANNSATLIREDSFEDYAREYAEDVWGDGVREMSTYINWSQFADALRTDYYSIDHDGHAWLRRA